MRVFNGVFVFIIIAYVLTVCWANRERIGSTSKKPEASSVSDTAATASEGLATAPVPPRPAPTAPAPAVAVRRSNAATPHPAAEGRAQAAALYPELATPGSEVNQKFIAFHKEAESNEPALLSRADWPLTLVERAVAATGGTVIPRHSAAAQAKMGRQIILFGTSHCHYCQDARQYFAKRSIYYQEYDIEKSPAAKETFRRLGGTGTPLILVGSKTLHGFEAKDLDDLVL